jgi:anti-sigma factor RsiW
MTRSDAQHIDLDRLGDFLDGYLPPEDAEAIRSHLSVCSRCREQQTRLESLMASTRGLPQTIEPPPELWARVQRRVVRPPPLAIATMSWGRLAAAALILVASSAGITAWLIGRQPSEIVRRDAPPVSPGAVAVPVAARAVAANYDAALRELNETLAERRAQLDPATVAKVEASLHVIDLAIGEARGALAADPANRDLLDLLAASYERKLELLQRANALLPST